MSSRNVLRGVIFMAGAVLFAVAVHAYNREAGTTVGSTLLRGQVGAAPAALGGAYTAIANGPLALRYNPAGLSREERKKLFLQYNAHILDIDRSDIALTMPLGYGALGISFSLIDYGNITRTTTVNRTGAGLISPKDYFFRAGYGKQVSESMHFGGTLGVYKFELDDDAEATGLTADFAFHYLTPVEGLTLGGALRNIGTKPRFQVEREELPFLAALGLAYQPIEALLFVVDGELINGEGTVLHAGAEYTLARRFKFRLGYNGENDADNGLTAGAGFATDDIKVDYAYTPFGDFGNSHQVSMEVAFGKPIDRQELIARRRAEERRPEPQDVSPVVIPREEPIVFIPPTPTESVEEKIERLTREADDAFGRGDHVTALRLFRDLTALDDRNLDFRYNLATVCYLLKMYGEAAEQYATYLVLNPMDEEAWLYRGYAEYHSGMARSARRSWMRVIELNPENEYARSAIRELGLD